MVREAGKCWLKRVAVTARAVELRRIYLSSMVLLINTAGNVSASVSGAGLLFLTIAFTRFCRRVLVFGAESAISKCSTSSSQVVGILDGFRLLRFC